MSPNSYNSSSPAQSGFGKAIKPGADSAASENGGKRAAPGTLSTRWAALNDAGNAVALMAGLQAEETTREVRTFPAIIRDCGGWRHELARNGVDDLASFMEPGLASLLAVAARGQSASAPAMQLWQEFHSARAALLTLMPETTEMGPMRSA